MNPTSQTRSECWSLTARWVIPVATPPLENGIVVIEGDRLSAIEPAGTRHPDLDLGNAAILPGLVNAHTHLDLSILDRCCPPTPDFTAWLRQVIQHRRQQNPTEVQQSIQQGLEQSLRCGVTLVGDITAGGASWSQLAAAPLRAVVFHELLGLTSERAELAWSIAQEWLLQQQATETCRPGLSPHAPYSVRRQLFELAARGGPELPLAIHVAETAFELELLAERCGPFRVFLTDLGVWDAAGLVAGFDDLLRINQPTRPLLVHANYLDPQTPLPPAATIVYCPRTHAAFGHPPHPWLAFHHRGIRVALGTDSLASNPDLNPLAEARFLHQRHPEVSCDLLLRLITLHGAEALSWADATGSLEVGKSADLVVVPVPGGAGTAAHLVLESEAPVTRVLFRGHWRGTEK